MIDTVTMTIGIQNKQWIQLNTSQTHVFTTPAIPDPPRQRILFTIVSIFTLNEINGYNGYLKKNNNKRCFHLTDYTISIMVKLSFNHAVIF